MPQPAGGFQLEGVVLSWASCRDRWQIAFVALGRSPQVAQSIRSKLALNLGSVPVPSQRVLGGPIHHARNPVSISDSTHNRPPNGLWHPLFRFRPGAAWWLFSERYVNYHMII